VNGDLEAWLSIPPIPAEQPPGTCDWGYCDNLATVWRWTDEHGWLPVCHECEDKPIPTSSEREPS
jgi:hypothetical protein